MTEIYLVIKMFVKSSSVLFFNASDNQLQVEKALVATLVVINVACLG